MEPRQSIALAARRLLDEGGREAVSTRAIAAAAGVQAPTIYRLYGDKQGLLDAVAEQGYEEYVASKLGAPADDDPVEALRRGWDDHVAFGLAHPALYALMVEPRSGGPSPAVAAGTAHLRRLLERIAAAGRLAVPVERAMAVVHAAGVGAALTAIDAPEPDHRAIALVRDAAIGAVTTDAPAAPGEGPAAAAVTLRAQLAQAAGLSEGERVLLAEWLDRIASPSR